MTERTPVYFHLLSGTPGVDAVGQARELPTGDTLAGHVPVSAYPVQGLMVRRSSGLLVPVALAPSTVLGRLGSADLGALSRGDLLSLLRAVTTSAGAADVGKPALLDSTGKFDASCLPAVVTGGEANTASNVGGAAGLFKAKAGVDLAFRSLQSTTTGALGVTQATDLVQVGIVFADSDPVGTGKLWSSSKIAAELATKLAALVGDSDPTLGADLDLDGFRLMDGAQEVLRVDSGDLYIFGRKAIIPDLTGLADGYGIYYDQASADWIVAEPPAGGGGGTAAGTTFTPAGDLAATDVQAALEELDTEKAPADHGHGFLALSDVDTTGVAQGDAFAYHPTAVGGAPGVQVLKLLQAILSPNAYEASRILIGDGATLVDALLELGVVADVVLASVAADHELGWDPTARSGAGAWTNRPKLNSEALYVTKQGSQAIDNTGGVLAGWSTVTWDESAIRYATSAFTFEGGTGTTDRQAIKFNRAGTYRIVPRLTQKTVSGTTGVSGRSALYLGDTNPTFGSIAWGSPLPGSTIYNSTGSLSGAEQYQTVTYGVVVTVTAGQRIRLDYQRQAVGDANLELSSSATALEIYGPFAN